MDVTRPQGTRRRWLAGLLALALLAGGCGGESAEDARDGDGDASSEGAAGRNLASIGDDGKTPKRGGTVNYALGAETDGGFCLPEAQLSSGIAVADAIYDTLTVPDENREPVPFLAESVEPNDDFTEWTITLREGVTFHDGTPLDATVVKNNLDAYRGTYPARKPLLFLFTFSNVADVAVADPLTVKVTTKKPWVTFDNYLFSSGRLGIMAQAQLDDTESCDRKLIGTGPFKQKEWKVGDHFTVERNPDYWIEAPDGEPYPYLDSIVFRPITEDQQRVNALQAGDIDVMTSGLGATLATLTDLQDQGEIALNVLERPNLVGHVMLNASKPPFDDLDMRRAMAHAIDTDQLNEQVHAGRFTLANGPFASEGLGHLEDTGFPTYDLEKAKELVEGYEQRTGKPVEFVLNTTPDPAIQAIAELFQQQAKAAGMEVRLKGGDQATLINLAIGGEYQATLWTNSFAAGDPDEQYVWWYGQGNPVNFGRIDDPEIDRLLDEGRSEPDPEKRRAIYEDLNRQFAKNVWNVWTTYTTESLAASTDIHGLLPPELPSGDEPYYLRVTGDPVYAMWKE